MSKTPAALLPMSELMAASISPEDLDFELDPDSQYIMSEFEVAWKRFMKENPTLVPEGKREKHIKELQNQAKKIVKTQKDVEEELHKQLNFFEKSKENLEKDFQLELEDTRTKQQKTYANLQQKLDSVAIAEHLLSQAIPWEHFLESVDKAAEISKIEQSTVWRKFHDGSVANKAKPSKRAMFLVDSSRGAERDIQLRAYQIDHALLSAQVKMLQKEAEGYQKLLETQKSIGKLLNDNNVWSMVTKPAGLASTFLEAA